MIVKLEETFDNKTPELNKPKSYVLIHNRFNTYLVLIFDDLNEAHFFKTPYRNSPHHEIEGTRSLKYLNLPQPNEDKNFLFENENKKDVYTVDNLISFETSDKLVEFFS